MNLLGELDAKDSDKEVLDLGKRARDDEAPSHKLGRLKKRVMIVDMPIAKEVEMAESYASPKVPKMRRSKWKPSHFPLVEGQEDYSIVDDLAHRTMNITLPNLLHSVLEFKENYNKAYPHRSLREGGRYAMFLPSPKRSTATLMRLI